MLEVNPAAEDEARRLPDGPLHGVPLLVKDNIDTAAPMHTTAGSLALAGVDVPRDAPVVRRLREAGALILGKSNLSEWANYRGGGSISGWSAVGGQCRNPHVLDRSPCGSSSGSAAAVAAGLCAAALGTETDGSVVCPSAMCGVVGVKPTVGLTSREGVVPVAPSQDTVGVHARSVADAAAVLTVIGERGIDYGSHLDDDGLRGARIGVPGKLFTGYSRHADRVLQEAITIFEDAGATVVDPADLPSAERLRDSKAEKLVMSYEFRHAIEEYQATRPGRRSAASGT